MSTELSDRFLTAFSHIEHTLKTLAKGGKDSNFLQNLKFASSHNAVVRSNKDDLQEFAELRNAIVHDRRGHAIAEPHEDIVKKLEDIDSILSKPATVSDMGTRKVTFCRPSDRIGNAARIMLKHSFSQLPVYSEQGAFVGLLTSKCLARWIADKFTPEIDLLEEESVKEVLSYGEEDSIHQFISRKTTLAEIIERFDTVSHEGRCLEALIVTQDGKSNQTPINILTVFDLPQILRLSNTVNVIKEKDRLL